MPLLKSYYEVPFWLQNNHIHTIYPTLRRKLIAPAYKRIRLKLRDEDFLDIDFLEAKPQNHSLVILFHGLESNSQVSYMVGMGLYYKSKGFDVAAVNFRGCSGKPNLKLSTYHSGKTDDIDEVFEYFLAKNQYQQIVPIGFSLGANALLKYLGEKKQVPEVKMAAAVSPPCHLHSASRQLEKPYNRIYSKRFLASLIQKVLLKKNISSDFPFQDHIKLKTLYDFDSWYTAPVFGYHSAMDYYEKNSSLYFLAQIKTPTLILMARDDPFFPVKCYPVREADANDSLYLEIPSHGAHVGFVENSHDGFYWHEKRIWEFGLQTGLVKK